MKLNYRRTFLIGFAFMAISVFWQMYDNIIPLILQNTFHLKEGAIGAIMAADNVLAVFLLPVIGAFSDRVDTRLGKRMPFIVGGTAAAVVSMMLLPVSDRFMSLPMFIIALGVTLFAMGMYRSPAVALMPDLTPKPLRSKANAVTTAFSRYAVTVWGLEDGGTASKLPSGDPGGLRGDRRGLGGDRCELSSHGGGDEQGQGRGKVYGPLLYIFHDGADCDADPLRSFAPVCLLPGHVSLCGGVQRGGLCDHALRKTRGQQARVEKVADRAL